ncbi:hypothetical protein [Arthrobacter gengyunqii]|uniref:Uncharacterized protein n=1 Tax=Arthrobacter gengyunqii TaxID=2886940 RepID=A0ABS8GLQ7_9MICC|nr:hypothetical protein [Arthrobacter gengyunqii]MCC3267480.1 hypothetical protein [Arthrobacter gengyunqii]
MAPSETALELLRDIAAALQADGPVTVGTTFRSPGQIRPLGWAHDFLDS